MQPLPGQAQAAPPRASSLSTPCPRAMPGHQPRLSNPRAETRCLLPGRLEHLRDRHARRQPCCHQRSIARRHERRAVLARLPSLQPPLGLLEQRVSLGLRLAAVLIRNELPHERLHRLAQLVVGAQRLGDAVDRREGARDEGKGRWEGDGSAAEQGAKLVVNLLRDVLRGPAGRLVAEELHQEFAHEPHGRLVGVGGEETSHLEALHHAVAARGDLFFARLWRAVEEPKGNLAHALHRRLGQGVHHAKVVQDDLAAGRDAHVARVRVAVQHARGQKLHQEGVEHLLAERLRVEAQLGHLRLVGHLHALDVLHRQHPLRRHVGKDLGHHHVGAGADE
mmetsp:Transcript_11808/g.29610  ORF Transcript_11808/g.29610 Transcript_11808/m.29610 type:complete len:336 (-) Transcript_11808:742-1749(-)